MTEQDWKQLEEMLGRARAGEAYAFAEACRILDQKLKRLVKAIVWQAGIRPGELVDDAWQDAMLAFVKHFRQVESIRYLAYWLARTALRAAWKYRWPRYPHKKKQEQLVQQTPPLPPLPIDSLIEKLATPFAGSTGNLEKQAALPQLEEALAQISPEGRTALILHYFWGLSCKELATELNVSKRYARRLISKSLAEIRASWGIRLPAQSNKATPDVISADPWWRFLMESMWRHAEAGDLGTEESEILLVGQFPCLQDSHSKESAIE